jgi:hypothetical protein
VEVPGAGRGRVRLGAWPPEPKPALPVNHQASGGHNMSEVCQWFSQGAGDCRGMSHYS